MHLALNSCDVHLVVDFSIEVNKARLNSNSDEYYGIRELMDNLYKLSMRRDRGETIVICDIKHLEKHKLDIYSSLNPIVLEGIYKATMKDNSKKAYDVFLNIDNPEKLKSVTVYKEFQKELFIDKKIVYYLLEPKRLSYVPFVNEDVFLLNYEGIILGYDK